LTWSIVNTAGTDFDKFTIDPNTGVLAFISAPSFESPNDVGGQDNDNKYVVDIQVSDGVLTDTQTIEVQVTNVTVNATDDIVRTGSEITVVPEWALLHNDTSSVGNILDITATGSVSDLSDASLGIIPGSVTIINNDADGGSFVYTASDGIETDTATATVETGATPMTGDNDDEILVGTPAAETINGGGGNDILIGGGGADTLIGGNGDDVLVYAPGVSFITGGSNLNANVLAANNRGDILSVSGTVDFTSLPDVFEDIETISMLAKDGSAGNSTITLDVTDVLDLADSAIAAFASSSGFASKQAIRIDGTSGDVVNLGPDPGTWLLATGATGVPNGYTAYSHVTSGLLANTNEDAYLFIQTGITVHGVGT
jgi:Ca2+-binding RTX toxin-like protein